jgi:opacity protein-like surface antigen
MDLNTPSPIVITISAGVSFARAGVQETFLLQPDILKTYSPDSKYTSMTNGSLFLGLHHRINKQFDGRLGLDISASSSKALQGDIWEDADPDFNNSMYNYAILHRYAGFKGVVLVDTGTSWSPYGEFSIGFGFNKASHFSITPYIAQEVPEPGFGSAKITALSYSMGLGLEKKLNYHWSAGIGYEFSDWGGSKLGAAPGQTINQGLMLDHLYTYQINLSINFIS